MGQRRAHRGLPARSDLDILHSPDMEVLRAIQAGEIAREGSGVSPIFRVNEILVNLRSLAREDLCTSPIGGMPVLQPRGQRLLQVARGELPMPLED